MDKQAIIASLIEAREFLNNEKISSALKILKKLNVKSLFNYLAYTDIDSDEDADILNLLIVVLQNIYNNFKEESPITDEQYDILYEKSRMFEEIVGSTINNASNKTISSHIYQDLRGSLNKTHFITKKERNRDAKKSIEDWYISIKNQLKGKNTFVNLTIKFDGVSVIFECENDISAKALSRGDVTKNEAVVIECFKDTKISFAHVNDKRWRKYGVKTEVIMKFNDFTNFKKKYGEFKSPRSAVSSILNSNDTDPEMLPFLTIVPLQVQDYDTKEIILPNYLFDTYGLMTGDLSSLVEEFDYWTEIMANLKESALAKEVPADGVVIRLMNKEVQDALGRDGSINRFEVAYKFPPDEQRTILRDVCFEMGILGGITPVAKIAPVVMSGNTIKSISLGSMDRLESLDLVLGQEVIVTYNIIPYLKIDDTCERGLGAHVVPISHCEFCEEELVYDPVFKCGNESCPSRMMGKIVNYLDKMRIMNISTATVSALFKEGLLTDIAGLYMLEDRREDIIKVSRIGTATLNNILKGIDARKSVYDYELLGAIGIVDVGRRIFKKILNIYHIDDLIKISSKNDIDSLTSISGIGEKMANKILKGVRDNEKLIKFLSFEIGIKRDTASYVGKVCFTKVRDSKFQEFLLSKGILTVDGFSKDLQAVIIQNASVSSSKTEKAIKNGIPVLTLKEAYKKYGYRIED